MSGHTRRSGSARFARRIFQRGAAAIARIRSHTVGIRARRNKRGESARLVELLERAVAVPLEQRAAFVDRASEGDQALRSKLIAGLEKHDAASAFFDGLSAMVVGPAMSALVAEDGTTSRPDLHEVLLANLGGAYRIGSELSSGGMSRVFIADDLRLKRRIVIKVLPLERASSDNADQFRREIELAARLQHPHIVPLLAAGRIDGILYYTMPFVAGESLSGRLRREGALTLDEAVRIWRELLDALSHAHTNGVIHRDIKPDNILLSGRHALVTDFGISRAIESASSGDDQATSIPLVVGTPAYLAPEVFAADPTANHSADIYAAGLVMYEMLAGVPAFQSHSLEGYRQAHQFAEPAPQRRTDAHRKLVALVAQCMAKDPHERPQSADAVLAELAGCAESVHPQVARRLRANVFARVSLLAIVALGLLAAVWGTYRGQKNTSDATREYQSASGLALREPPGHVQQATSPAAYEWYARGMDLALLRSDAGRQQGISYFRRAIAIDTAYVDAYAGLVRMYLQLSNASPSPAKEEWLELARQAAMKAVAMDGSDSDAHAALGWVHLLSRGYAAAEAEFVQAIELDPSTPRVYEGLARVFMMTNRPLEQLEAARRGIAADPFSHSAIREFALALATNGRCAESLEQLQTLKALTPPAGVAGVLAGQCYASMARWAEAIEEFRWAAQYSATAGTALRGFALGRAGRTSEAEEILEDLLKGRQYSHGSWGIAIVYAGLGDSDNAFLWLDRAVDDRSMHFYIMHPVFGELQRDPRFESIRRRLGADGF